MWTGGSVPSGHCGKPASRHTLRGVSRAAAEVGSNGNAPNTIGTAPDLSAARAEATSEKLVTALSATSVPVGPDNTNAGPAGFSGGDRGGNDFKSLKVRSTRARRAGVPHARNRR